MTFQICIKVDCHKAGQLQEVSNFYFRADTQKYKTTCKSCVLKQRCIYYKNNKSKESILNKIYYQLNKQEINCSNKNYRIIHKQEIKEYRKNYYLNNKDKFKTNKLKRNQRKRFKLKNDPIFKLKEYIGNSIRKHLKNNHVSKCGIVSKYLGYTIKELKNHIEKQFEPWMTWQNHGLYKNWDDNDPKTWTWQLDHIIPQSDLPYLSMKDDNFKKCWSLDNLRPYSAKQNVFDGVMRIRHK